MRYTFADVTEPDVLSMYPISIRRVMLRTTDVRAKRASPASLLSDGKQMPVAALSLSKIWKSTRKSEDCRRGSA